jgi:hypothetical protein
MDKQGERRKLALTFKDYLIPIVIEPASPPRIIQNCGNDIYRRVYIVYETG